MGLSEYRVTANVLHVHTATTTIGSLRETVPWSLNSIPVEIITNYIQKSKGYTFAYLGGDIPGTEMEMTVKKFSKEYKSHRHVGDNE